jgi:lipopolysaccharide export LptBFGC system permease protein LptF
MNSFYWTQTALVLAGAVLAFFISFGPNRNRTKWLTAIGIAASVALFVANQVVMSKTGDGLDKQLNCWIWPAGVACPKPNRTKAAVLPDAATPAAS